jgi:hypothetical protein
MTKTEPDSSPHLTFLGRWTIFLVGVGGVVNEAFIREADARAPLLVLFAAMMSLPGFVRLDNWVGKAKRAAGELTKPEPEGDPEREPP